MSSTVYRLRARTQMVVTPGETADGQRVLLRLGKVLGRIDPYDATARRFLHALADGGDVETLRASVVDGGDRSDWARAEQMLLALCESGFCEVVTDSDQIGQQDRARFQRLLDFLSEFESAEVDRFDLLTRLREARVAVLGTGGMGSWAVYHLACCGVGRLRLIDGDVVEASNLNRAILYDEVDIGARKVAAAERRIRQFAPRTEIETVDAYVTSAEGLAGKLDDVDLVVCCADQPTWVIRQWVTEAARNRGVPVICASGFRVGPFYVPGKSSCPMCDWLTLCDRNPRLGDMLAAQRQLPTGSSGSLSFVGATTASLLAWEVFRHLTGSSSPLTRNGLWEMSADGTAGVSALPVHAACPVCAGLPLDGPTAGALPIAATHWSG